MKKLETIILLSICTLFFYSCSKIDNLNEPIDSQGSMLSNIKDGLGTLNLTDTILPLDSTKFVKKSLDVTPYGVNLRQNLVQLEGWDFYLVPVYTGNGTKALKSNGKSYAVTLANKSTAQNQLFHFVILPATSGIPFLIYSSKEGTPMGGGSTAGAPNDYLPYLKSNNTGSLFGFSWDFEFNSDSTALYVVNQDMLYQIGGSPWNIGNYVLNASSSGDLTLEKKNSSIAQQFNIVPDDIFQFEGINLSPDEGTITSAQDVSIANGVITNPTSAIVTSHVASSTDEVINYSFNETTGFTTTLSSNPSFSINLDVVKIGNSYTITNSNSYSVSYGVNKQRTQHIEYSADIQMQPYSTIYWRLVSLQGKIIVPFTATVRGVDNPEELTIRGYYTGGTFSTFRLALDTTAFSPSSITEEGEAGISSLQNRVSNEKLKITYK